MKRLLILTVLLTATVTYAQHITEQEAMDRALKYMNSQMPAQVSGLRAPARGGSIKLESAPVEAQSIYAFNAEGGGFIIASADSRTLPVLGYSDSGNIDWERMPENMRAWLMQYDEAVATLGNRTDFKDGNRLDDDGKALARTRTARPPVEPLIKTRWSQSMAPYDNMAPLYAGHNPEWQGQRCVAGCGAVAMAQILNYWQWPKSLPDGLPAYEAVEIYDATLTWHIDALPPVIFDWENMLDGYIAFNNSTWTWDLVGTETQQQAVATLMRYCSQAMESDYSPVGTSNNYVRCRNALVKHFGYDAATYLYPRQQFGIDEWEEMVYTELAAGRPIYYSGTPPTADGHAFVCDGYDGNGLFHINWGWQGLYDGYYSLSVLNPWANTNPNKGSEHLGFTLQQCMIIGLDPSLKELKNPLSEKPELWQYRQMEVLSEKTVRFYFLYNHDDATGTATADYALGTIEADGTLSPRFIVNPNDSIILKNNWMTVEIDSTAFQPGETLRLHPMLRFRHTPEAEWQLIPPLTICADAGLTEDGRFIITRHPYMLECVDASITSGLGRLGASSDLTFTVKNPNDQDYVGDIRLRPRYYGKINAEDVTEDTPYTEGDWQIVGAFIRAGQDGEATFLFNPEQGGLIRFMLIQEIGKYDHTVYCDYFDSFTMRFDTIYSYDPYLVNNSYLTHDGNHYVYHVELCDRPGVTVPDGVPSDSIYLDCRISSNDEMIFSRIKIRDEIRDYLRALPDSAGSGNYKFTAEVSLDIEQDGEYFVWSYLNEWLDAEYNEYIGGAEVSEDFTVTVDPTAIKEIGNLKSTIEDAIYDLQGRRINGIPQKNRVYMKDNRKVIINK